MRVAPSGIQVSCLAARCGARAWSCAKRERIARQQNTVTSIAKPVRSKERAGVGPVFLSSVTRFRRFVAWIERSEIRERRSGSVAAPGFRSAQPGLRNKFEGSGTPANAGSPTAASCDAARALLERARLSAFHRGSHLREYSIPKAQLQARLPGTWSERALPAFACPSPGKHLPPRSSCRGTDTQAAREQAANPPAGTALAPMTRCASASCPSRSEDCDVTDIETHVNEKVT